jgi:hypothetical protein
METTDPKALAAASWFGYGRWDAPYWFVGMEPGGDDDRASYESWLRLAGPDRKGLIDCKEHHDDSNSRSSQILTRWHADGVPPIQNTWGPLIRTMLAFDDRARADNDVASYQRDDWGRSTGKTAVIELSALHARSLDVDVERTLHRSARIETIRKNLDDQKPKFAVFYGRSYRPEYEKIAGPVGPDDWAWRGETLCVLVVHPAYRYAPGRDFWFSLGTWLRAAIESGPSGSIPPCPHPPPFRGGRPPKDQRLSPSVLVDSDAAAITRDGSVAGRILYDGWNIRVERRLPVGGYELMGYYERSRPAQFDRKRGEIDAVFDEWVKLKPQQPGRVKAKWRAAQFVPGFNPPSDAINAGCAVLEDDSVEVARIFKVPPDRAIWVWSKV